MKHPRVFFKRLLSRFRCLDAYCRDCGRAVHDYIAPDWAWEIAAPEGSILCYDDFQARLNRAGVYETWRLTRTNRRSQ